MTTIQKLYNRFLVGKITPTQFIVEAKKTPQLAQIIGSNSNINKVIAKLKSVRMVTDGKMHESITPQIAPITFNNDSEVHLMDYEIPKYINFIYKEVPRQIDGQTIQDFIDATYEGDTEYDRTAIDIATDLILAKKGEYDAFEQIPTEDSIVDLKRNSEKVISLSENLNYENVSSHEFNIGFQVEFDKCKDSLKASKIVLKNLEKSPSYYTTKVANAPSVSNPITKKFKKDELVDNDAKSKKINEIHGELLNKVNSISQIGEVEKDFDFDDSHAYRYGLSSDGDKEFNPKLETMIKKHFNDVIQTAQKYDWTKNKMVVLSRNGVFRLQLMNTEKKLITYDVLRGSGKSDSMSYTILFNEKKYEFNNIRDCYKQLKLFIQGGGSIEKGGEYDAIIKKQFDYIDKIARENNYTAELTKSKGESDIVIKDAEGKTYFIYLLYMDKNSQKFSIYMDEKTVNYSEMGQAFKKVVSLITKKSMKRDKSVETPIKSVVNTEIDKNPKYQKIVDAIVKYKDVNDKGYLKLINFLTKDLYKNDEVKSIIDNDYGGDTNLIKNVIVNDTNSR